MYISTLHTHSEEESDKVTTGKFSVFPKLPFELRLMIWRFCLPGPRNVGIKIRFKAGGFGGWVVRGNIPRPPVALQVCQESREEALRYYILSFGTNAHPATVYFNYQVDTLCFSDTINHDENGNLEGTPGPSDYLLNLWVGKTFRDRQCKAIQAAKIRFLTLDVDESIYSRPFFCWDEVRRFEGLEKLLLVAWGSEENSDGLMTYFRQAMRAVAEAHSGWVAPKTEVVSASGKVWGNIQCG